MSKFRINILGCGSATPSLRHKPSCQVIDFRDNLMMVDCGEGAQLEMRRQRLKYSRLSHIFISHLHGDHCLGLTGLLSTLALHGRTGDVTVHIMKDGADLFKRMLDYFNRDSPYEVRFNIITPRKEVILDTDSLTVETFPLYHRVPCAGFIFREKEKPRHVKGDMMEFHDIPRYAINAIRQGEDFVKPDGSVIPNHLLTTDPDRAVSYAYCSDTMFDPRVAEAVAGVDTIYHEATYDNSLAEKARQRGHSTAAEAARIARMAGASRLIIGHYSKRYLTEYGLLAEARAIFPDTIAANEGLAIDLL